MRSEVEKSFHCCYQVREHLAPSRYMPTMYLVPKSDPVLLTYSSVARVTVRRSWETEDPALEAEGPTCTVTGYLGSKEKVEYLLEPLLCPW